MTQFVMPFGLSADFWLQRSMAEIENFADLWELSADRFADRFADCPDERPYTRFSYRYQHSAAEPVACNDAFVIQEQTYCSPANTLYYRFSPGRDSNTEH
jgi:hypothetical protein